VCEHGLYLFICKLKGKITVIAFRENTSLIYHNGLLRENSLIFIIPTILGCNCCCFCGLTCNIEREKCICQLKGKINR